MSTVTVTLSLEDLKKVHKPYMLFSGSNFYPSGGWDDFKGYFSSIEDAKLWLQKNEPNAHHMWAHIVYNHKIILWASCQDNLVFAENGLWQWRTEE